MFFNFVFLIILIFIIFLLEISLPIIPLGVSFIFIFIMVFLLKASKDKDFFSQKIRYVFFTAIIGGFLLDCYSIFFPGTFFLSLLTVTYLSKRFFLLKFNTNKILSVLIFGLVAGFIYQFLISFFIFISSFFQSTIPQIYFNGFYWLNVFQAIVLNGLLIVFLFWALNLIKFSKIRI
ncbi:MAG: hypothetical protein PHW15_00560 [Patescibacteria group bacterium]|jgi:hypothetical protein|nr:hypothetical protein [Patescibacteria group bacterium]MDD5172893.1 hypothetical protein [Patescibacteria group bacterium]